MVESALVDSPAFGPAVGIVAALGCALAWTVLSLITRDLAAEFPTFSLNIIRSAVGSVLLGAAALALGDLQGLGQVSTVAWVYIMTSVLTAVGVGDTAFFESTKTLGLARALTISTCYPLMASGLAFAWFGEAITAAVALGSVVTLGGLVLIVSEQGAGPGGGGAGRRRGLALALLAALAWAISAVLMKIPLHEADPLTMQAVRLPLTTLLLWATPWARGTARALWSKRRAVGGRVLALGALTALSAVGYLAGLKYAGVTLGTVLSSVSPLFALPIGRVAYGEPVTWRATVGAVLTVGGIAVLSR
jgi:drug/metabolite transporter (DMT)-like permease